MPRADDLHFTAGRRRRQICVECKSAFGIHQRLSHVLGGRGILKTRRRENRKQLAEKGGDDIEGHLGHHQDIADYSIFFEGITFVVIPGQADVRPFLRSYSLATAIATFFCCFNLRVFIKE